MILHVRLPIFMFRAHRYEPRLVFPFKHILSQNLKQPIKTTLPPQQFKFIVTRRCSGIRHRNRAQTPLPDSDNRPGQHRLRRTSLPQTATSLSELLHPRRKSIRNWTSCRSGGDIKQKPHILSGRSPWRSGRPRNSGPERGQTRKNDESVSFLGFPFGSMLLRSMFSCSRALSFPLS